MYRAWNHIPKQPLLRSEFTPYPYPMSFSRFALLAFDTLMIF